MHALEHFLLAEFHGISLACSHRKACAPKAEDISLARALRDPAHFACSLEQACACPVPAPKRRRAPSM